MRKTLAVLMLAALLPVGIRAQEKKEEPGSELVSKVFEVKPGSLERISNALRSLLGHDAVRTDSSVGMVIVRTRAELMPAAEQVIKRLDVAVQPPSNVELTFYLVQATHDPLPGAVVPPELQSTIAQLKNVFAYQGFQILDTTLVRSRGGRDVAASGVLSLDKDESTPYSLSLRPSVQGDDKARSIRIDELKFNTRMLVNTAPNARNYLEASIRADIDVKEGQKVVVGKVQGSQRALILVVTGKIVD